MRPVRQTRFSAHDGNCFEACVATLLHVETDEVPIYTEVNASMNGYLARLDAWLAARGLAAVTLNVGGDRAEVDYIADDTYWIGAFATDGLDADHHHAIVMRGSTPVWDPQTGEHNPAVDAPLCAATFLVAREHQPGIADAIF